MTAYTTVAKYSSYIYKKIKFWNWHIVLHDCHISIKQDSCEDQNNSSDQASAVHNKAQLNSLANQDINGKPLQQEAREALLRQKSYIPKGIVRDSCIEVSHKNAYISISS